MRLPWLAAEQGDPWAQSHLSMMYDKGEGVPQDYVLAHMWANIVTVKGIERDRRNRERIAAKMTLSDITKAQQMARKCLESGYNNCGY